MFFNSKYKSNSKIKIKKGKIEKAKMKIIIILLANLFLVNSLAITNQIDTTLLRNKIDSVDKHAKETDDDDDDDILVPD